MLQKHSSAFWENSIEFFLHYNSFVLFYKNKEISTIDAMER